MEVGYLGFITQVTPIMCVLPQLYLTMFQSEPDILHLCGALLL